MEKKGLCVNCDHVSDCVLPSKLPVWHCQEFCIESGKRNRKKKSVKKTD